MLDGGQVEGAAERIIGENLFGFDKDPQAVEVTKLNLWLKLLKSNPQRYMRSSTQKPVRLPDLVRNVHVRDSLVPRDDLATMIGNAGEAIVVGNPPWGADLDGRTDELSAYRLFSTMCDSYELFTERALEILPEGGMLGYVIPDSVLHLPERRGLRELLLRGTRLEHVVKLGEGVFEDVFRAAVALVCTKSVPQAGSAVTCAVIVKSDRKALLERNATGQYSKSVSDLESEHGHQAKQSRFLANEGYAFDIYTKDTDEPIRAKLNARPVRWQSVLWTGRGVELTKRGLVVQCPACSTWNNIPKAKKDGTFASKQCSNRACNATFQYDGFATKATIVDKTSQGPSWKPLIVGSSINRYRLVSHLWIDTSKTKTLPKCPVCGGYESSWADIEVGAQWFCSRCNRPFARGESNESVTLGINYKPASFYKPLKLLVRKTGRGIYSMIERSEALTNQVVFIFRIRDDLTGNDANRAAGRHCPGDAMLVWLRGATSAVLRPAVVYGRDNLNPFDRRDAGRAGDIPRPHRREGERRRPDTPGPAGVV
ncbi:MAG: N-6 DNA methylase [Chloroflexota bacterium]|nr:N-6 DNA methylase [Chloroflexota bacterium]